jgi:hypothetical protein
LFVCGLPCCAHLPWPDVLPDALPDFPGRWLLAVSVVLLVAWSAVVLSWQALPVFLCFSLIAFLARHCASVCAFAAGCWLLAAGCWLLAAG